MNKETLALILVMGIAGFVILGFVIGQQVYGHMEFTRTYEGEFGGLYNVTTQKEDDHKILHITELILEEEKKQTKLLDHIDCMIYTKKDVSGYTGLRHRMACGTPLNLTGVWNP